MAAVNCVLLAKLVVRLLHTNGLPAHHCTTAPSTKFVPFIVSVKAPNPTEWLDGESELIIGTGLLIANWAAAEGTLGLGFATTTAAVPAAATSLAVIAAVSCVLLT